MDASISAADPPPDRALDSIEVWPVVVVGAGAAGLMTALWAARGGARVLLLERKRRPGAKILISGGGRCNVLPSAVELGDFHTSGSKHTLRNVLFSWPLDEVRAFFESDLGIALYREANGKLFPVSDRAREVLDALVAAALAAGVELRTDFELAELRRLPVERAGADPMDPIEQGRFELTAGAHTRGARVRAVRLVLATGGLSIPKTGSDGRGLALAEELGLRLVPRYPALVPLCVPAGAGGDAWRELAGISLPVRLAALRGERVLEEREGDLLFTHRGFSGPVVLDLSRFVTDPETAGDVRLRVSFAPAVPWEERLLSGGRATVLNLVREALPRRLAQFLVELAGVDPETRLAELRREDRAALLGALTSCPLPVAGSEGYSKAEVTGGGVELGELRPATLEARAIEGLYLVGEILDVTGRIGGFNFLWSWVTGRRAGTALAAASRAESST